MSIRRIRLRIALAREVDGSALHTHDPQVCQALARRAPGGQQFEQDVVQEHGREHGHDQERVADPAAGQRSGTGRRRGRSAKSR